MSEEILVVISGGGKSVITAKGFVGTACLAATAPLELALGKTVSSVPTDEMRATTATLKVGA